MAAIEGIWFGLAGVIAVIAGLTGLRRVRRLRRDGVQAWAVVLPAHPAATERGIAFQYTLPDGRALEKHSPGRTRDLLPGERVLIWYDPADPQDVLVRGCEARASDLAFVTVGTVLVAAGMAIGII